MKSRKTASFPWNNNSMQTTSPGTQPGLAGVAAGDVGWSNISGSLPGIVCQDCPSGPCQEFSFYALSPWQVLGLCHTNELPASYYWALAELRDRRCRRPALGWKGQGRMPCAMVRLRCWVSCSPWMPLALFIFTLLCLKRFLQSGLMLGTTNRTPPVANLCHCCLVNNNSMASGTWVQLGHLFLWDVWDS